MFAFDDALATTILVQPCLEGKIVVSPLWPYPCGSMLREKKDDVVDGILSAAAAARTAALFATKAAFWQRINYMAPLHAQRIDVACFK